eukprot:TRINITY_DN10565_c0_g2_i1.p1 TRINITY_DN10565_c0_g2~~TRINITY_DN10565_c0_g2_i1.p1  ORF type:complete len:347 (+),score=61.07 TRINITY_DN10565_c0_g2_i1:98-1042(+)
MRQGGNTEPGISATPTPPTADAAEARPDDVVPRFPAANQKRDVGALAASLGPPPAPVAAGLSSVSARGADFSTVAPAARVFTSVQLWPRLADFAEQDEDVMRSAAAEGSGVALGTPGLVSRSDSGDKGVSQEDDLLSGRLPLSTEDGGPCRQFQFCGSLGSDLDYDDHGGAAGEDETATAQVHAAEGFSVATVPTAEDDSGAPPLVCGARRPRPVIGLDGLMRPRCGSSSCQACSEWARSAPRIGEAAASSAAASSAEPASPSAPPPGGVGGSAACSEGALGAAGADQVGARPNSARRPSCAGGSSRRRRSASL